VDFCGTDTLQKLFIGSCNLNTYVCPRLVDNVFDSHVNSFLSNVRINPFMSVVSWIHGLSPILLHGRLLDVVAAFTPLDRSIETSGIASDDARERGPERKVHTHGVSNVRRVRQTHRCGINAYLRNVRTVSNLACRSAWRCSFNGLSGYVIKLIFPYW